MKKRLKRKNKGTDLDELLIWWDEGTSRNDVSPDEFSGTPVPLEESSLKHNVPALIHPTL